MKKYLPSTKSILQSILLVALLGAWFLLEEKRHPTPQYPVPPRVPPVVAPQEVGETKLTPAPIVSLSSKATADEIIEKINACEVRRLEYGLGVSGTWLSVFTLDDLRIDLASRENIQNVVDQSISEGSLCAPPIEVLFVQSTCPGHPEDCM